MRACIKEVDNSEISFLHFNKMNIRTDGMSDINSNLTQFLFIK